MPSHSGGSGRLTFFLYSELNTSCSPLLPCTAVWACIDFTELPSPFVSDALVIRVIKRSRFNEWSFALCVHYKCRPAPIIYCAHNRRA